MDLHRFESGSMPFDTFKGREFKSLNKSIQPHAVLLSNDEPIHLKMCKMFTFKKKKCLFSLP